MKVLTGVYAALALLAGTAAVSAADPPKPAPEAEAAASADCPWRSVSIYFQQGAAEASAETGELIARAGATAAQCRPARVDLVAHIDPSEGDDALRLALDRLTLISRELTRAGLPATRIRVATEDAARAAHEGAAGRHVDILLRPSVTSAGEDRPAPPPAAYDLLATKI